MTYYQRLNPLNAELNPIRHLVALVGARHIVHVSRIRVKGLSEFYEVCFWCLWQKSVERTWLFLWKLAQWKPHVTWGCKWISNTSFHICWHVLVKLGTEGLHVMPFINYALLKTSTLKKHTFLLVENEKLSYYLQVSFDWDKIRPGKCAQKFECLRVSWKSEATLLTGVNYPHFSHLLFSLGEIRYKITVIILLSIFVKIVPGKVIHFLRLLMKLHLRVYLMI